MVASIGRDFEVRGLAFSPPELEREAGSGRLPVGIGYPGSLLPGASMACIGVSATGKHGNACVRIRRLAGYGDWLRR